MSERFENRLSMPMVMDASEFLADQGLVLDVRSPLEFSRGHLPGAVNFPLFSDEERAKVGTCYKREGAQAALILGLRFVGPKMADFVRRADLLNPERSPLRMYCFRGGQRSQSMAWLIEKAGHEITLLRGGYKAFRNHVLRSFEIPQKMIVLSGCTGSAKTETLKRLSELGEQVIDIEAVACHRGSAFGGYFQPKDLSTEMFENRLFMEWRALRRERFLWVEDESRSLGKVFLPAEFWRQLRAAPVVFLDIPQAARVDYLVREYGEYDRALLADSVDRIAKRLGPQTHAATKAALETGNYAEVVRLTLGYYDKAYRYSLAKRRPEPLYHLSMSELNADECAANLLKVLRTPGDYLVNSEAFGASKTCTLGSN